MLRRNYLIKEEQDKALRALSGHVSEHIRNAIDEYLAKKKKETLNVSESKSEMKGGE